MLRMLLRKMSILSILGNSMKFTVCNPGVTSDIQPCDGAKHSRVVVSSSSPCDAYGGCAECPYYTQEFGCTD